MEENSSDSSSNSSNIASEMGTLDNSDFWGRLSVYFSSPLAGGIRTGNNIIKPDKLALRKAAEKAYAAKNISAPVLTPEDCKILFHELGAHQIELELQNNELQKAQEEADTLRSRYVELYDYAPVGYMSLDKDCRITEINLNACAKLGIERDKYISTRPVFHKYILPSDQVLFYQLSNRVKNTDVPQTAELRLVVLGKEPLWVQLSATKAVQGEDVLRVVITDISERKAAEDIVLEKEHLIHAIADYAVDWEIWLGPTGVIQWVNLSAAAISGYEPDELLGLTGLDCMVAPADLHEFHSMMQKARTGIQINNFRFRLIKKDGAQIWVGWSCREIKDRHGNDIGIRASAREITQEVIAEQALKESKALLQEAQEVGAMGSYMLDFSTGIWSSTEKLDSIFGIPKDYDRTVDGWLSLVHPDDRLMMSGYLKEQVEQRQPFDKKYRIVRYNDITEHWVHGRGKLEFDESGVPTRMVGTIQDITENYILTMARDNWLATLKILTSRIPAVVCQLRKHPDGFFAIPYASEALHRICGVTPDEVRYDATSALELVHPMDREPLLNLLHESAKYLFPIHYQYRIELEGEVYWLELDGNPEREINGGALWHCVITDRTSDKRKEEELHHLRTALDQIAVSIIITDTDEVIKYVNPAFEKHSGYSAMEVVGHSAKMLQSGKQSELFYKEMWVALTAGKVWRGQFHSVRKDGTAYWESATIAPVYDSAGILTNYICVKDAITESKFVETANKAMEL